MIGDSVNRFVLQKDGVNPLIVVGINPSTASETKSDATIRKVMGFSERLGFDSFIMLNLYPFRSTDPSKLPSSIDNELHNINIDKITQVISNVSNPTVLMAYGNNISKRDYLSRCLRDILKAISAFNPNLVQLGELTKQGNPRHPLMQPYNTTIKSYIR